MKKVVKNLLLILFGFVSFAQGANASALEKEIGSDQFPPNEHYFGLVNVSEVELETLHYGYWPKY